MGAASSSSLSDVIGRLRRLGWLVAGAIFFLLLLFAGALSYLNQVATERRIGGEVISMSGDARMLVGRIALQASHLSDLTPAERESLKSSTLREAVSETRTMYERMRAILVEERLIQGAEIDVIFTEPPYNLDEKISTYLAQAEILLVEDSLQSREGRASLAYFATDAPRDVNASLTALASETRNHLFRLHDRMRDFSLVALSIGLLGLLGMGVFGVYPLILRVRRGFAVQEEEFTRARQQSELLTDYLNGVGIALFVLDRKGRIQMLNRRAQQMLGVHEREAVGQGWCDLFVRPDLRSEVNREFSVFLEGRSEFEPREVPVVTRNGKELQFHCIPTYRRDVSGRVNAVIVAAFDVSLRKKAEDETRRAKDAAERASQAKTQFLASLSHDLRSPMNAILGFTELLLESELPPPEKENYLGLIRRNGQHLLSLINDLLDLSRIEAGGMKIEPENVSVLSFISELIADLAPDAEAKSLEFEVRSTNPLPEIINTDRTRLRQVIHNLVGNAIKYTPQGKVEIEISYEELDFCMHVRDTGPGIAPIHQDRLFEAFERLEATAPGTGLGLVIAKRLSQQLGGDVWLEWSRPGRGSDFGLRVKTGSMSGVAFLPPIKSRADWRRLNETVLSRAEVRLEGRKILIVDDSPDNLLLFERMLRRAGAEIVTAEDGQSALQRAAEARFDLILLDIQLPDIDGYEVARRLRAMKYSGPVVALTAHALAGEHLRCRDAGCDGYLTKPISGHRLIERVAMFLTASESQSGDRVA